MFLARRPWLAGLLAVCTLVFASAGPAGSATNPKDSQKTVTYRIVLQVTGTLVVGPFSSTQTVTADIIANPTTPGSDPSQWQGEGDLAFGPISNAGLPKGCELTTISPTGTLKVAVTKSGESVEVNWSTTTAPIVPSVLVCQGVPAPFLGGAQVEPFLLLEPKTFTVPAAGGTQQLKGSFTAGVGMMENVGSMTLTQRIECGQKIKQVNTYPPGQATSASAMVGRGFAPGEKVTADTKVEFVFEDGSVARIAKGDSIMQDAKCESFVDKSKSYKGTLLLGKIWWHVTKALGQESQVWDLPRERAVTGHRGTTFWVLPGKKMTRLSVSEGSMWVSHAKKGQLIGKRYTVRRNQTAEITKKNISVRKQTKRDAFPFG